MTSVREGAEPADKRMERIGVGCVGCLQASEVLLLVKDAVEYFVDKAASTCDKGRI